jgi:hypothetical protein
MLLQTAPEAAAAAVAFSTSNCDKKKLLQE